MLSKRYRTVLAAATTALVVAAVATMALSAPGPGQGGPRGGQAGCIGACPDGLGRGAGQFNPMARLLADVDLTDAQREQVTQLRADFRQQQQQWRVEHAEELATLRTEIEQERENGQPHREKMRQLHEQVRALMASEETDAQVLGEQVLELRTQLEQARAEGETHRAAMTALHQKMKDLRATGPQPKDLMDKVLGVLTDEQREIVQPRLDKMRERMEQMTTNWGDGPGPCPGGPGLCPGGPGAGPAHHRGRQTRPSW